MTDHPTSMPYAWCPTCERNRICVQLPGVLLGAPLVYRRHGCPTDGKPPLTQHVRSRGGSAHQQSLRQSKN